MKDKTIGIYAIFRKSDDKCMYIGQSKQCEARIGYHLHGYSNTQIENHNDYYADIIEKHGFDSTEFRLSREAFWINMFEPEWNKMRDRTHCKESRQKMSESHLGKTPSEETRQKISESLLGKPHIHSKEARQKMSKSHLGKPSGMKDKTHSKETRQKISKSHLGKPSGTLGKHWKLVDGKRVYY